MLLWDHCVRRLMHTSPPWDVPQASPSAINQVFRSRDASPNLKLRLVLFQDRSLFSFRSNTPIFRFPQPSYSTSIQLNSMKMPQPISQSSSRRFKHSEIVFNFFYTPRTYHQFNANLSLNSPPPVAIQYNTPQFASSCQHLSRDRHQLLVGVSNP